MTNIVHVLESADRAVSCFLTSWEPARIPTEARRWPSPSLSMPRLSGAMVAATTHYAS
jgi:hypothetical protein